MQTARNPASPRKSKRHRRRHILKLALGMSSPFTPTSPQSIADLLHQQNFVIVMITPTLLDKLQWKAYLIFMCTNLAFVPLVFFCKSPQTTTTTTTTNFYSC